MGRGRRRKARKITSGTLVRERFHNRLSVFFNEKIKWRPFELTFSSKVLMTTIFPRTDFFSFAIGLSEIDNSECLAEFYFHKNDALLLLEAL